MAHPMNAPSSATTSPTTEAGEGTALRTRDLTKVYGERVAVDHLNLEARRLDTTIIQRQELASQNARLAERGRIARDLHDSIKQQVFAIGLHLGAALALWERDPAAGAEHVRHADTLAHQTQQELTTLIHEMRPLALQAQGFPTALGEVVTTWSQQTGVPVDLHVSGADDLPSEVENALLRVIQEGVANVARHSQARHVSLTVEGRDASVTLTLVDDGRGFSPHLVEGAGVGLSSMRERMNALGGALSLDSAPGQGTRILARCPFSQKGRQ